MALEVAHETGIIHRELKFPELLHVGPTVYLLTAIAFNCGVAISEVGLAKVWLAANIETVIRRCFERREMKRCS